MAEANTSGSPMIEVSFTSEDDPKGDSPSNTHNHDQDNDDDSHLRVDRKLSGSTTSSVTSSNDTSSLSSEHSLQQNGNALELVGMLDVRNFKCSLAKPTSPADMYNLSLQ